MPEQTEATETVTPTVVPPEPAETQGDPDKLGDAGKRALDAERRRADAAERARKDLQAQLDAIEAEKLSDLEKAQKAAQDAVERATAANRRILQAEVKAAAAGKLADPADALRLLDLDGFTVGDDGSVDSDAITAAVADLLTSKPYLAASPTGPVIPAVGIDQGARDKSGPSQITSRETLAQMSPADRLKAAQDGRLAEMLGK